MPTRSRFWRSSKYCFNSSTSRNSLAQTKEEGAIQPSSKRRWLLGPWSPSISLHSQDQLHLEEVKDSSPWRTGPQGQDPAQEQKASPTPTSLGTLKSYRQPPLTRTRTTGRAAMVSNRQELLLGLSRVDSIRPAKVSTSTWASLSV